MNPNLKYRHATSFKTNNRLRSFKINENDLFLIIKNLNSSKAYFSDHISIWMIQSREKSIALPLEMLLKQFKTILEEETFPEDWKEFKNLIKNYQPITSPLIFSKILESLIFNSIVYYKLFTECQSGFIPGDYCVAQILWITH